MLPDPRTPLISLTIIALFMAFIGLRVHYTWIDEVYFAEPAINFLRGDGYTSSVWNVSQASETHVSTAPAYSSLLIGWLKIFGVSQTAVRVLPLVLAVLTTIVFWRACLRAGIIHSAAAGIILVSVALLSYGFSFSYTTGRPEALSALALAGMFYFAATPPSGAALIALALTSFALPFIQWSAVIFAAIIAAVLLTLFGAGVLRRVLGVAAGIAAGMICQYAIYRHLGLWDQWLATLSSERSLNLLQHLLSRVSVDALRAHSNTLPKDFTAFVLLAGVVLLGLATFLLRIDRRQQLLTAATAIFAAVLVGMFVVGKFPTYYGWMLTFPLAAILAAMFDRLPPERGILRTGAVAFAVLSCLVGFPAQAAVALNDWPYRTPDHVNEWLQARIQPDDIVYCDYPFYYLAKEKAQKVFAGRYSRMMTPEELDSLDLILLSKTFCDWSHPETLRARATNRAEWDTPRAGLLGNDWRYGILSAPNYSCTALRLAPASDL